MDAVLLKKKLDRLRGILLTYKKVLVAYSGGLDSTFLLKCCCLYLAKKPLAVTAVSPTYTARELRTAQEIARSLGVCHKLIRTQEAKNPSFAANPKNRCYYCKKELFLRLRQIAVKEGIDFILDGSNLDDLKDYRPGLKAKKELGVLSPLAEAGLTKQEIRKLSRKFGLPTWNLPPGACLASRFAYGQRIAREDLVRIARGEGYLRSLGIEIVRLRHYRLADSTRLARIEVDSRNLRKVVSCRLSVISRLKKLGYNYVTLDLEGYKSGSMNEGLGYKRHSLQTA